MITLAADIGGTRIKLGIVCDQSVLAYRCLEARSDEGLEPQLPRIAATFASLCGEAGIRFAACEALGVAFPSIIVDGERVLTSYGKYRDAPGLDLRGWAREEFGLPLVMDNDARVAQLGEWRAGTGRGCDDFNGSWSEAELSAALPSASASYSVASARACTRRGDEWRSYRRSWATWRH
jgi:glucokinase